MAEPVIAVEQVSRVFRDFWGRPRVTAVDSLSFTIERGRVFGLLGPNGSGKSTTVRMLLDLLRPTRGRISILGRPPSAVRTKERIGYLPEETPLYPFLNAEETLAFFGKLFDLPATARRERIEQLIDMVGLTAARRRPVGEYSKGMQRRLGLAQALLNDPDLVILDEPTSGLDPLGIREFKDLIRTLAGRGKTVLLSSHILADVEDVCDEVLILLAGRTIAYGPLDQLLSDREAVQITVPAEQLEAVRANLSAEIELLGIGSRRRSLEDYFIELIRTAGSEERQGVAAFLDPSSPEDALAGLAPAAEPEPEPSDQSLAAAAASLDAAFGDDDA